MSRTTMSMVPRLKVVAEKMMDNLEKYPSSPYTESVVTSLESILGMIDKHERNEEHPEPVALIKNYTSEELRKLYPDPPQGDDHIFLHEDGEKR